ncbi:MAG: 1-acyl-sn-glycerol-3-phosphate acyltransferase [Deltaproteobacteria bacterium]|nr:1-acyl-sn-glycerol-3-phosphate acyltransferase [Deltaproteobacteria bacterium]
MWVTCIRRVKGLVMLVLFGLFFVGILMELIFVFPFLWLLSRLAGPQPYLMQSVHSLLFGIWLFPLRCFGLLREKTPIGIPYSGPCLIVANHPGLFDVLFLIRRVPMLSMMVKSSLAVDLPLGKIFKLSGYIPAPEAGNVSPVAALLDARNLIQSGYKFLFFPEGTRSPKGGLRPFKHGLFRLARMAGVPIQPVLIRNEPPFLTHDDQWRNPPFETSTIQLEFWDPLTPPEQGAEREFANMLESRYRETLGLEPAAGRRFDD